MPQNTKGTLPCCCFFGLRAIILSLLFSEFFRIGGNIYTIAFRSMHNTSQFMNAIHCCVCKWFRIIFLSYKLRLVFRLVIEFTCLCLIRCCIECKEITNHRDSRLNTKECETTATTNKKIIDFSVHRYQQRSEEWKM